MKKTLNLLLFAVVVSTVALIESCSSEDVEKCDGKLSATAETESVTTCTPPNGSITITATNGTAPYKFQLNGGTTQTSATFSNLAAGTYVITVTDDKGCEFELDVTVNSSASSLNFTTSVTKAKCDPNSNGEIQINATGGSGGYTYAVGSSGFSATNPIPNLSAGSYTIKVKDSNGCEISKSVSVGVESALTYNANIKSIIDANCTNGECHASARGIISKPLTTYSNVNEFKNQIRNAVSSGSMPKNSSLDADTKNKILCWIDSGAKE